MDTIVRRRRQQWRWAAAAATVNRAGMSSSMRARCGEKTIGAAINNGERIRDGNTVAADKKKKRKNRIEIIRKEEWKKYIHDGNTVDATIRRAGSSRQRALSEISVIVEFAYRRLSRAREFRAFVEARFLIIPHRTRMNIETASIILGRTFYKSNSSRVNRLKHLL